MASTEALGKSVSWAGPMVTVLGRAAMVSSWPISISFPLGRILLLVTRHLDDLPQAVVHSH